MLWTDSLGEERRGMFVSDPPLAVSSLWDTNQGVQAPRTGHRSEYTLTLLQLLLISKENHRVRACLLSDLGSGLS